MVGDFQKLLLAKADVRVMIFDLRRGGPSSFDRLQRQIEAFDGTSPEDRYFLAGYDSERGRFHVREVG